MTDEQAQVCTCAEPAAPCPACLARRDRHGFPKDWRERMRRPCPTCIHPEGYDRLSGPCPTCDGEGVASDLACEWCGHADGSHGNGCRLGLGPDECVHEWLDRPESDTRECLICGTEVAG